MLRRPQYIAVLATFSVLVAGLLGWAFWPNGPTARARQYLAFKACLLTGSQGLGTADAASIWSGMQKASLTTRARVQYLPAFGPTTVANTRPYLASLFQRHCEVIVGVGKAPVAAVLAEAPRHPNTHFIVVAEQANHRNVIAISGASGSALAAKTADLIVRSVRASE